MKRHKKNSGKHKIKVILVSDDNLVLDGWEQALRHASDIQIRKTIYKTNQTFSVEGIASGDIYLFEASLLKRNDFSKQIADIKFRQRAKTIAVFKERKSLSRHRRLLDEAIQIGFHRQELIDLVRGLRYDDKSLCTYYDAELKKVTGKTSLKHYSHLLENILQLVFGQNLQNPQPGIEQSKAETGSSYIVFENKGVHPFWSAVRKKHNSEYIVFSVQNNPSSIPTQFSGITAFLSEPFGKMGFLINRQIAGSKHTELQNAAYKNEGQIILVLFNHTIHTLLALKAAGADPTDLLEDLYQGLFLAIQGKKR